VQIWIRILERGGAPDPFAGIPSHVWVRLGSTRDMDALTVEKTFAPEGLPRLPEAAPPDGDCEAEARQRFELAGLLDFSGGAPFAPLPPPPAVPPPPELRAVPRRDLPVDGLVDPGADLLSFGPDTGTFVLRPDREEALVMLPLGATRRGSLTVHAYLSRPADASAPVNGHWRHADAGADRRLHFSLHTRAFTEQVLITPHARTKIAAVIRPHGTAALFAFEPDTDGGFRSTGFPLPPNDRLDYVLRDTTPDDHLDGSYELCFGSGITHVFSVTPPDRAEGRLACVRHADGRETFPATAPDCDLDPDGGTFRCPRWNGTLIRRDGRLAGLRYRARTGEGEIRVSVGRDVSGGVVALRKSIPELSETLTRDDAGRLTVTAGSGIRVRRDGTSLTRTVPGCGTVRREWDFNADGLPVRVTTAANGSA